MGLNEDKNIQKKYQYYKLKLAIKRFCVHNIKGRKKIDIHLNVKLIKFVRYKFENYLQKFNKKKFMVRINHKNIYLINCYFCFKKYLKFLL